jgi:hypothetical protein
VLVALYASVRGLRRRAAPGLAAAGALLALTFGALLAWGDPVEFGTTVAVVGAAALWARGRWRASQAALAEWRSRRDQALEEELRALRRRRQVT